MLTVQVQVWRKHLAESTYLTDMNCRIAGVAALIAASVFAGCFGHPSQPTVSGPIVASGNGDYPHRIVVDNEQNQTLRLQLTVQRNGSQIYNQNHTIQSHSSPTVAGITTRSLPDPDELTVTVTNSNGQSASIRKRITSCLGGIVVTSNSERGLEMTYEIC